MPTGILSSDVLLADLSSLLIEEPTKLWWALLDSVLAGKERDLQRARLNEILKLVQTNIAAFTATSVSERVLAQSQKRVLLIDGVETAFGATQTAAYVEGLFGFLATIQSDLALSQRLTIRLFIRTDLAEGARENIEQQTENRVIYLAWDTQTILNFVLVRLASIPWFRQNFVQPIIDIEGRTSELIKGTVTEEDCGVILLKIFPEKVRRNNVGMLTFLKTYFSDGQGEKASFYPRIYDSFLRYIADGGSPGTSSKRVQLEDARIAQDLIFDAHAHACRDYLKQVKDELKNLLDLADNSNDNQERINDLLEGFSGMATPFRFDECVQELTTKLTPTISDSKLRKAMLQMKRVGIFEDRPDYPGHWRVGRLFKSSLGMRYYRKGRGSK
jgi:hypothetical protein